MLLSTGLNVLSAVFAIAAAIFWYQSARVQLPSKFIILTMHTAGEWVPGEEIASAGSSPDLDELANGLKEQSRLSAKTAKFAAIAAGVQAVALFMPWH